MASSPPEPSAQAAVGSLLRQSPDDSKTTEDGYQRLNEVTVEENPYQKLSTSTSSKEDLDKTYWSIQSVDLINTERLPRNHPENFEPRDSDSLMPRRLVHGNVTPGDMLASGIYQSTINSDSSQTVKMAPPVPPRRPESGGVSTKPHSHDANATNAPWTLQQQSGYSWWPRHPFQNPATRWPVPSALMPLQQRPFPVIQSFPQIVQPRFGMEQRHILHAYPGPSVQTPPLGQRHPRPVMRASVPPEPMTLPGSGPSPHLHRRTDTKLGHNIRTSQEEEVDDCYLFVKGFGESTSRDCLCDFVEAKTGLTPLGFFFGPEPGTALFTLTEVPELSKMKRAKIDGAHIKVCKISQPQGIVVSTTEPVGSVEAMELYFENTRRSGGGDLCQPPLETDEGYHLIDFSDVGVVKNVCADGRRHLVDGITLSVSPYFACDIGRIWNDELHSVALPKAFTFDIEPIKVTFLEKAPEMVNEINDHLKERYGKLHIVDRSLECTLTQKSKNVRTLARNWRDIAEKTLLEYLENNVICKEVIVSSIVQRELLAFIADMDVQDTQRVVIVHENNTIFIVGKKALVEKLEAPINAAKKEIESKLDRKTRESAQDVHVKVPQLQILVSTGFLDTLKKNLKDIAIELKPELGILMLKGVPEDIVEAKLKIHQKMAEMNYFQIADMTKHQLELLGTAEVKQYTDSKMQANQFVCKWQVEKGKYVEVFTTISKNAGEIEKIIRDSVVEHYVRLKDASLPLLSTPMWHHLEAQIRDRYVGKVDLIRPDDDQTRIIIVATEDVEREVLQSITTFIKDNTKIDQYIQYEQAKMDFLLRHCQHVISGIQTKYSVVIHCKRAADIHITGTEAGINDAVAALNSHANTIHVKYHKITKIGVGRLFTSDKGQNIIDIVQTNVRCTIQPKGLDSGSQDDDSIQISRSRQRDWKPTVSSSSHVSSHVPHYTSKNGLTITVVRGELAKQSADVIVCATSGDLNLSIGAASKSLLTVGGKGLQDECRNKYPNGIAIAQSEVAVIGPGNLQCKEVHLGALPEWRKCKDITAPVKFVETCLEIAAKSHKKVVAIPAIGTGQLGYPRSYVARELFSCCVAFDANHRDSTITEVRFVVYQKDHETINAFETELGSIGNPRGTTLPGSGVISGGIRMTVITDKKLTEQKVDVIVSATSKSLDLSKGAVSVALLQAGGKSLADECKLKYPYGIEVGTFAEIQPGKLPCKSVYLGFLPPYSQGSSSLLDFVTNCLKVAEARHMTSMAFPALGTGQYLKYPRDVVASQMFQAVRQFGKGHPSSCLKAISFLIHYKDSETKKAFLAEEKKQQGIGTRKWRVFTPKEEPMYSDANDDECMIGDISLRVYKADITTDSAEAIVNTTDKEFHFRGGVAKAIQSNCNRKELEQECGWKKKDMQQDGIAATSGCGLPCKNIIHIEFQSSLPGWNQKVLECLDMVEGKKLQSVAFPVLGSGGRSSTITAKVISKTLYEAVAEFGIKKHVHLKDIRLVVFQSEMLSQAKEGLQECRKGARSKDAFSGQRRYQIRLPPSEVTFQIYFDGEKFMKEAIMLLEKKIKVELITETLKDGDIKQLNARKIEAIDNLQKEYPVAIDIKKKDGVIKITGATKDISDTKDKIQKILRQALAEIYRDKEIDMTAVRVQWFFREDDKMFSYPKEIIFEIEKAYYNRDKTYELPKDSRGKIHIIDFNKMVEYDRDNAADEVAVIRRDIFKDAACQLPDYWQTIKDQDNVVVVVLKPTDTEFKTTAKTFLDSLKQAVQIQKISRIQNRMLYEQYQAKKKLLERNNPKIQNEMTLFHGTNPTAAPSIINHGFNRSFCGDKTGAPWYGSGVYFSPSAACSAGYTPGSAGARYIFITKVLTGEYVQVPRHTKLRVPPCKDPQRPHILYDAVVDNQRNPVEFVIFNDTQAYPQYLIQF